MDRLSFPVSAQLEAMVKAYQYLAGLISDREVWVELEKVLAHYFKADLVAFLGRRPDGGIVLHHLSRLGQADGQEVLAKAGPVAAEVLNSGFLATEMLDLPQQTYSVAFLPIAERQQATRVMLVGHRLAAPLPRPLLDVYLALAGLCGATLERLAAESRMQRMTEKVPEMLFELLVYPDGALQFTYVSRQAEAIFLQSPDVLLDHPGLILDAVHPDDRRAFLTALREAADGAHRSLEIRGLDPAGREKYILFHARASLQQDRVIVWDGAFSDITDRKRAETAIRQLNEELEQRVQERTAQLAAANKELESFAYSVSHDLRAPLRAMDGYSRILIEDYSDLLDDQAKGYLDRISAGSRRMSQLIDDILKLSQLSRTQMVCEPFEISALAREIAAELRESAPERRVEFHIADRLAVRGSRRLLRIALVNLLSNAWKFTANRSQARIEFGAAERDGHRCYFVRDNGPGFQMAYVDKIFQPFERLHKDSEFPGSGIGLTLVQRIIQRHGGEIWAESEEGRGTVFYFTLGEPA